MSTVLEMIIMCFLIAPSRKSCSEGFHRDSRQQEVETFCLGSEL